MTELAEDNKIIYSFLAQTCPKWLADSPFFLGWQMKFSVNRCKVMHGGGKEIIRFLLRG